MAESTGFKYCDIVMKGGITSGIVYPLAVWELAKEYRFKNIGGTSAGAIAAAVTAAAEYGRRRGNSNAFSLVKDLPDKLGSNDLLLRLFRPSPKTARVFKTAIAALKASGPVAKVFAGATALIGVPGVAALLLFVVTMLVLPAVALFICRGSATPYIVLIGLWVLFWGVVVTTYLALRGSVDEIVSNKFGLCPGFDSKSPAGDPPLTNWLHHQIQAAAGRKDNDDPLTIGDLWNAPAYPGETLKTVRTITFEVVTTSLTQGHPFTIPFKNNMFYFDEDEFRGLFPAPVVDWLVSKQRPPDPKHPFVNTADGTRLCRIPLAADTPVLLASRMSLSFPILLCAIPLYAVDFTLKMNQNVPPNQEVVADKCWFSDGGISSNFPIQFFDSALPRWPTFGIDLKAPHPDYANSKNEADFVWLPTKPGGGSGTQVRWNDFEQGHGVQSLVGFVSAIINTMQNWRDNLQATAAGYRERIVHVSLRPREGGLNLTMGSKLQKLLRDRGSLAGQKLATDFDLCTHIWARYRLTMCSLARHLDALRENWNNPVEQDECGWRLINCTDTPNHYVASPQLQAALYNELQNLLTLLNTGQRYCPDSPHPEAVFRGQPNF